MDLNKPADIDALAQATRTLLADAPVTARVAISYLHVRNAHPTSLDVYQDLDAPRMSFRKRLFAWAKPKALLVLAALRREQLYFGDALPAQADILFISHFLNGGQAGEEEDRYYGDLPEQLNVSGKSAVIAHINHCWSNSGSVSGSWRQHSVPRVVLSRTIGLSAERRLARSLRRAGKELAQYEGGDLLTQQIAKHAAHTAANSGNSMALRIAIQIGDLVARLKPKYVVTTFEGHPWERLAWQAVRAAHPGVKCIGYHHSVLFPHAHALATSLGKAYDPDAILTAGEISADWFRAQTAWQNTPVDVLGSVRTPSSKPAKSPSAAGACLVAPEGIIEESIMLFRLAAETARLAPDQAFRLRLHPVLSKQIILKQADDLNDLPANVRWSDCTLEADVAQCRSVLYRGSTVALTAALSGLRPYYVAAPNEQISIDPLRELRSWRKTVNSGPMLKEALFADGVESVAQQQAEFAIGRDYCERYFRPLNSTELEKLISEA